MSAHTIPLDIPRFPPDAKVPGTITSSAALLAHVLCLVESGERPEDLGRVFSNMLSAALHAAGGMLDSLRIDPATGTREAHIIGPGALVACSEYLQAKLAETVGWPAPVATFETWMHVSKHAVRPGTLVIQLGSLGVPEIAEAVRREVELRGGLYLNSRAVPANADVTRLRGMVEEDVAPSLSDVLYEMAFAQLLALWLLRRRADWAPYQAHRLSKTQIRGLLPRQYDHAVIANAPTPGYSK
jgi:hypothetical protein